MGLATEVRDCLQVEWQDPADPSAGIKYLYLRDADHARLTDLAKERGQEVVKAKVRGLTGR